MNLPPRQVDAVDKDVRIYVFLPASARLKLIEEASARGLDWYRLGGAVLAMWVQAGCPDRIHSQPDAVGGVQ